MCYIFTNRHNYAVKLLCSVLRVNESGYYRWLKNRNKLSKRQLLLVEIQNIINEHPDNDNYGVDRILSALEQKKHIKCSRRTVYRAMQEGNLLHQRRTPHGITKATDAIQEKENIIKRDFTSNKPITKLLTDITEVQCSNGKLYISPIFDCYNGEIVALEMRDNMKKEFCIDTVKQLKQRYGNLEGVILHSDRGSQYTSDAFRSILSTYGMIQSLSSTGKCFDNARMESFFATLKKEKRRRGKCCVNSIKTNLLGENYGRNNFYQGGFSTMKIPKELIKEYVKSEKFTNTTDIMESIKSMFADVLNEVLQCEMDEQLGYDKHERTESGEEKKNYRNGSTKRKLKTQLGEVEISVPRDRNGEYEPKIIDKYQRNADGLEDKILSLYAHGMSTRDIQEQIKDLYNIDISSELVSKISEKILPEVNEWQNRPLEEYYPFIFMDAIHYKPRENHQIITKAAYLVLGVNAEGYKDILGIWVGANESSKFWLGVLNELKSRGVKNVDLFCVDGLSGFREAINAVYPFAGIQRCIIHQIRSSSRFVSYKHIKEFTADLKLVYGALNEEAAMEKLIEFKEKWQSQYPSAVKSWEDNWDILSTFFAYPVEIRKIIYTTNIIEGLNRQFRKVTKTKSVFPNDDSLRKMLYLTSQNITKKWTQRYKNWDIVIRQLEIMHDEKTA